MGLFLLLTTALILAAPAAPHPINGKAPTNDILSIVNVTTVGSRYVEIFWKLNEEIYDHAHTFKLQYEACRNGSRCHQEYEKVPFRSEVQEAKSGVFHTLEECQECRRFRITVSVFDKEGTCCGVDVYQSYASEERKETKQKLLLPEERLTTAAATEGVDSALGESEKGSEDKLLYIVSGVAGGLMIALVAVLVMFCVYWRKTRLTKDVERCDGKKQEEEKKIKNEEEKERAVPLVQTKLTYLDLGRRRTSSLHLEDPGRRQELLGFSEEEVDSCYPSSSGVSPASSITGFY